MKVTHNATYRLMQTNLDRITSSMQDLQRQGATGLKLHTASDDPGAVRPVLTAKTEISRSEGYLETMQVGLDNMEFIDGYLATTENILQRAQELTINAANSSLNNSDLNTIADEISELKDQLLGVANAKVDGKYLFSGYAENTVPFAENPSYDPALYDPALSTTWPYTYQGDSNRTFLEVSPGEQVETSLTGNELFLGVSNSNWNGAAADAANQPETGQVDMFSVLTRLEEAIRAGNVDDATGPGGSIESQMDNIQSAADQNRRLRSRLGAKAANFEERIHHQQDVQADLEAILSRYQDADAIETFNQIIQQETAYQAALNVTSRVSNISILNYL